MDSTTLELSRPPEFSPPENGGNGTVSVDALDWAKLLRDHNVLDARLWPPGFKEGAEWLARIRQIEAGCIAEFGEFDWEKLDADTQDEYDGTCAELTKLLTGPDEWIPWEVAKAQLEARRG